MSKIKSLIEQLKSRTRRGKGWINFDLTRNHEQPFPSKSNPFRRLTLMYPTVLFGKQMSDFGEEYNRYAACFNTGFGFTDGGDHRGFDVQILGFGFFYSVQWDY